MSRGVDREAAVERLLRQSFKAPGGAVPRGPCLDPEVLAAWVDGALKGVELTAAEAHLSDCSRCLTLLATLMKTAPEQQPVNRWWQLRTVRWLVPLTAGAAAVLIWIAVPSDEPRRSLEQTIARTEAIPAAPLAQEPTSEQRPPAEADKSLRFRAAEERPDTQAQRRDVPATPTEARDAEKESVSRQQEPAAVSPPEPTPKAEPTAPAPAPPAASADADRAAAATGIGQLATTSGETVATERAAAAGAVAARTAELRRANPEIPATEIVSPDLTIRWRAGARGLVQLSRDRGATWEPLRSGVTVDLTAGASPSPSVCWLVGRAGTVLLTADGRTWQRLTFPEPVDLTIVRATDARRAIVTTADGRTFTTADGGLTWTR